MVYFDREKGPTELTLNTTEATVTSLGFQHLLGIDTEDETLLDRDPENETEAAYQQLLLAMRKFKSYPGLVFEEYSIDVEHAGLVIAAFRSGIEHIEDDFGPLGKRIPFLIDHYQRVTQSAITHLSRIAPPTDTPT